jgi:hypothetical protein
MRGVLGHAVELWTFGSPGGLQIPNFSKCWASPPHLAKLGLRQSMGGTCNPKLGNLTSCLWWRLVHMPYQTLQASTWWWFWKTNCQKEVSLKTKVSANTPFLMIFVQCLIVLDINGLFCFAIHVLSDNKMVAPHPNYYQFLQLCFTSLTLGYGHQ